MRMVPETANAALIYVYFPICRAAGNWQYREVGQGVARRFELLLRRQFWSEAPMMK